MSKKYLNIILILIFVALASRFINISSFLSETDDQLPIAQLLKYDELNLYDLLMISLQQLMKVNQKNF